VTLYVRPGVPLVFSGPVLLGVGAQGLVFGIAGHPEVCFKVFREPSDDLDRRIAGLLRMPPVDWQGQDGHTVAWPQGMLTDEHEQVRAVVLGRVYGRSLHAVLDPPQRVEFLVRPTWATTLHVARRVAEIFGSLHRVGVVVGDVRPDNLLVDPDGRVVLIDCDSVQFTDPTSHELFGADVATHAYSSPEALRSPTDTLADSHDLFGLAILVCQLLMEGDHPFEGVPVSGPDTGVAGNVLAGNCRLFAPDRLVEVRGRLDRSVLPAAVRDLAWRALVEGSDEPARRPGATEWAEALADAATDLIGCARNRNHFYPVELGRCVWCARRDDGLGDHYPEHQLVRGSA
jgi:DNA-binding helix-hairpin-helix protein with protein kinase domain